MIKETEDNKTPIHSKPGNDRWYWLGGLVQTTDTLFPSGGYAHSYPEEQVSLGLILTKEQLEEFLILKSYPHWKDWNFPTYAFVTHLWSDKIAWIFLN